MHNESNEEVYYSDGYVWVTSRRVVHGGREQLLSGARGVRVRVVRAEDRLRDLVIYLLLLTGLYVALLLSPLLANFRVALIYLLPILACIFIWLLATRTRTNISREPIYIASVRYRFWSRIAVASMDQPYIERIVEVIQYAIARRDGTEYTMATPATMGTSSTVPSPIIKGNILYVGQTPHDLAAIRSSYVGKETQITWQDIMLYGLIVAQQLLVGAGYQFEGPLGAIIPVAMLVAFVSLIAVRYGPKSSESEVYTVVLAPRTGPRAIVFASTSKSDATQVQQSINESRKPEAVLQTS